MKVRSRYCNGCRLIIWSVILLFTLGCQNPALQTPEPPPHTSYSVWQTTEDYLVLTYGEHQVIDFSKGARRIEERVEEILGGFPNAHLLGEKVVNKRTGNDDGNIQVRWTHRRQQHGVLFSDRNRELDKLAEQLEGQVTKVGGKLLSKQSSGTGGERQIVLEFGVHRQVLGQWYSLPTQHLTLRYLKSNDAVPITPNRGKVAIVIDDLGGGVRGTQDIIGLNIPLTVAVLPHLRHSAAEAQQAHRAGHQVILHQPMEPLDETRDPGPGLVTGEMTDEEIMEIVRENLRSIPHAVGLNNHMGSKGTTEEPVVEAVLRVAKEEGVFFLDSRTNARSVVPQVAQRMNVPSAQNRVFLDNEKELDYIKGQIERVIQLAQREGQGIAIGHVHPLTAQAIREMTPRFQAEGIQLVYLGDLMQ